jgi:hypothetical protein
MVRGLFRSPCVFRKHLNVPQQAARVSKKTAIGGSRPRSALPLYPPAAHRKDDGSVCGGFLSSNSFSVRSRKLVPVGRERSGVWTVCNSCYNFLKKIANDNSIAWKTVTIMIGSIELFGRAGEPAVKQVIDKAKCRQLPSCLQSR